MDSNKTNFFTVFGDEANRNVNTSTAHTQRVSCEPNDIIFVTFKVFNTLKREGFCWCYLVMACDFLGKLKNFFPS